jgi:hypothetical protein
LDAKLPDNFSGVRRIVHAHKNLASVIVNVVDIECVVPAKPENHAEISADANRPAARQLALQRMQIESRESQVSRRDRRIENRQDQPETLRVFRLNASFASGFEKASKPFVREALDHATLV